MKSAETESIKLPKPRFDGIILAGNKSFIIKTAPLLAYYDHGPDRTFIFGNSQMTERHILNEPALNGAYFSSIPSTLKNDFSYKWKKTWGGEPPKFSALGYDVIKMITENSFNDEIVSYLTRKQGHKGFTGHFWLTKDGLNKRKVFVQRIENGLAMEVF